MLFVDESNQRKDFGCETEKFYNPTITRILATINGSPHHMYPSGILPKDLYPEIHKYFGTPDFDVSWEEFLTTKFGCWVDFRSSRDNVLHGSGRAIEREACFSRFVRFQRLVVS